MSKYSFLDELEESPIFKSLYEKGEGVFLQAAVAYQLMKSGQASRMASKSVENSENWIINRVTPEQQHINSKKGNDIFLSRLQNDEEFYNWFCKNQSVNLIRFKEENPEKFNEHQSKRVKASMQWRIDNPEEHDKNFKAFQEKGNTRRKELESQRIAQGISIQKAIWMIGLKKAWEKTQSEEWKNSEKAIEYRLAISNRLKNLRNDKNSDFYKNMMLGLANSEAKKKSDLENIKLANKYTHYIVTCPKCGKTGDNPIMRVHHFDKCTFNESLEIKALNILENEILSRKEIIRAFDKIQLDINYVSKYKIMERYFKKLYPNKSTSGKFVKIDFNIDAYFLRLEEDKIAKRKIIKLKMKQAGAQNITEGRKNHKRIQAVKSGSSKIITCSHCGNSGGQSGFRGWHFDYCLSNPNRKIRNSRKKNQESKKIKTESKKIKVDKIGLLFQQLPNLFKMNEARELVQKYGLHPNNANNYVKRNFNKFKKISFGVYSKNETIPLNSV